MTRSVTEPQLQGTASAGTLLTTATAYIHLFTTLDADTFFDLLSPDYEHTFAPDSLHMSGPIDKAQFTEREMSLRAVMSGIPLAVKHMWANPSLRQVVVWAHAEAQFYDHLKDINHENGGEEWACRIEYMFVLTMDTSWLKIEKTIEFLDSKQMEAMTALVGRAFMKKQEIEEEL